MGKCRYPDWEGGLIVAEHQISKDGLCCICGEPGEPTMSTITDKPTIEEIRQSLADITPWPWAKIPHGFPEFIVKSANELMVASVAYVDIEDGCERNAGFIANAPEYIDFLLAEVDRLKTENDKFRGEFNRYWENKP